MERVRVHNFSVSLDGFGTGDGRSLDAPFGHAGNRLHEWFFPTRTFQAMQGKSGTTGIDELSDNLNFNVYPNPLEENSILAFNLIAQKNIDIKIYDIVGREISTLYSGNLNAGEHQYSIGATSTLAPGVYFVTLSAGGEHFSKKLIVK